MSNPTNTPRPLTCNPGILTWAGASMATCGDAEPPCEFDAARAMPATYLFGVVAYDTCTRACFPFARVA